MKTHSLHPMVKEHFGGDFVPHRGALVVFDGYDQLEKEAADGFFRGMPWNAFLEYLHDIELSPSRGAAFMLEEWSVLEPEPLSYYARGYLEYLMATLETEHPNEEFIAFFFGELYQLVYSGRYFLLSEPQREIFAMIAHLVSGGSWGSILDPEYVVSRARFFLTELGSRGGVYSAKASGAAA